MSQSVLYYGLTRLSRLNVATNDREYLRNLKHVLARNSSSNNPKQKTAASVYRTMDIFDRNTKKLQRERAAQKEDYHLCEYVKEEVGWRTADRVFDIKRTFKNAVELGAARGYVSRHFTPDSVEHVTLCDTSPTHLEKAIVGDGVKFNTKVMDEEELDFPEKSVDLVVSSLTLHWVNDLPGVFDRVMHILKPDGVFLACIFGGDTLMELRQSLQLAELERVGGFYPHISPFTRVFLACIFGGDTLMELRQSLRLAGLERVGGFYPHISPFTRVRDIGGLLTAAGYTLQTVDVDSLTVWYPSAWEVMRDVRALGENNAAKNRPLRLPRDVAFAAAAIYDEMYGKHIPEQSSRGVPATFQLINFLGWKPDPSQPQPRQRGSGNISLKDLHKIDEIIKHTNTVKITDEDKKE